MQTQLGEIAPLARLDPDPRGTGASNSEIVSFSFVIETIKSQKKGTLIFELGAGFRAKRTRNGKLKHFPSTSDCSVISFVSFRAQFLSTKHFVLEFVFDTSTNQTSLKNEILAG